MLRKIFILALMILFLTSVCSFAASITFNSADVEGYDRSQNADDSYDALDAGNGLKLEDNTWVAINYDVTDITPNTVLSFDFKSTTQGEIHAIGFDNNLNFDEAGSTSFQIDGTQGTSTSWQPADAFDYFDSNNGDWKTYSINLNDYSALQGNSFSYLKFINDNDASGSNGVSSFRNVQVSSVPIPGAAWLLGAGLLGLLGFKRIRS